MGLVYRKRVKLDRHTHANVSARGVSISRKWGPLTLNSRGHLTIRLGRGLSWRVW